MIYGENMNYHIEIIIRGYFYEVLFYYVTKYNFKFKLL